MEASGNAEFKVNVNEFLQSDDEGGAKLTASAANPSPEHPAPHLVDTDVRPRLVSAGHPAWTPTLLSLTAAEISNRRQLEPLSRGNHLTPHGTTSPGPPPPPPQLPQAFPAVPFLRGEDKMSWETIEAHLRIPARPSARLPGLTSQQSSSVSSRVRPVSLPHSLPSRPREEGNRSPGTLCEKFIERLV